MPRLYKRGKVYYIDYRVDGKRIRRRIGSNRRLAEMTLKDIEIQIFRGELNPPKRKKPIKEFIVEFLDSYKATTKPRTYVRYRAVLDHFQEFLDHRPSLIALIQITPHHIENYKIERLDHVTPKTVNFELGVLRTFFYHARMFGFIKTNPVTQVKHVRTSRKPPRFFSKGEIQKIFDACEEDERAIFATLLYTGMRRGELRHLEWDDFDFEHGMISIRVKDYWEPKGGRSREIPIHEKLLPILKQHHESNGANRWVFSKPNGEQIDHLWRRFQRILKKAGLDGETVHTFRHTFASHLVMAGVDLPTIQKLMGHSNISTTMIYAHLAPDHLRNSLSRLKI